MALAPPKLTEIAADTGEDIAGGFVDELRQSRDEVLETHGGGDLSLYRRLLSDDQVMPTFHQRRSTVVERETVVEPGGDNEIDRLAADDLRAQLLHVSWDRVTYKMLAGLMFGYGVAECMYAADGARYRLDAIKVRRQERFRFAQDNSLRIMRKGKAEPLPERKFWTFSAGADDDDDPYGLGIGNALYWPVWFKRNVIRFWAIFVERFSQATPVAHIPSGSKEEERRDLLALLDNITGGGKIVLPHGVDLELIQAAKDSGGDYERFISLLNAAIAKIVLMQTMTTDDGSSMSQAQVHRRVQQGGAKSDADLLNESFMQGPARWLTEWNWPGAKVPLVYRDFTESEDLAARAARDAQLHGIGYRPTERYIRETYGDGYVYSPPPAAPGPGLMFAEPRSASGAVEELMAGDGWRRVLGPEVANIETLLEGARSLEEARDRLGELASLNPDQLTESLAQLLFAARVGANAEFEADVGDED